MVIVDFLDTVGCVVGERHDEHGGDAVERIAALWGTYLGRPINSSDVCLMMVLLKVARAATAEGQAHDDNWLDIAGYAALGSATARAVPAPGIDPL
jgi:hypothetical protein